MPSCPYLSRRQPDLTPKRAQTPPQTPAIIEQSVFTTPVLNGDAIGIDSPSPVRGSRVEAINDAIPVLETLTSGNSVPRVYSMPDCEHNDR